RDLTEGRHETAVAVSVAAGGGREPSTSLASGSTKPRRGSVPALPRRTHHSTASGRIPKPSSGPGPELPPTRTRPDPVQSSCGTGGTGGRARGGEAAGGRPF